MGKCDSVNQTVGGRFIEFLSDPAMVRFVENEVDRLERFDLGSTPGSSRVRACGCAGRAARANSPAAQ